MNNLVTSIADAHTVRCDDDDGATARYLVQEMQDPVLILAVQGRCRFVSQYNRRSAQKKSGHRHSLLLATAQDMDAVFLATGQTHLVQNLSKCFTPTSSRVAPGSPRAQSDLKILCNRTVLNERVILKQVTKVIATEPTYKTWT
ncbi:hypothetical protein AUCHE_05_00280 [Austwickia chelonae NBRC 105200]|uniref:Uncharacterized protein n=1 Tax=Austwickia chelonae NBRC 105200 TaxID=1184607 RepID=K6VK78_9MICO|nr:hypothetical protein AUCHE_05_00280 [Austwickia chelonae NBRC 105200]